MLDARKIQKDPLAFSVESMKAISSVSMSPEVPGLLATTSLDGKVKIYDTQSPPVEGKLNKICEKNPKLVASFSFLFYHKRPNSIAASSTRTVPGISLAGPQKENCSSGTWQKTKI